VVQTVEQLGLDQSFGAQSRRMRLAMGKRWATSKRCAKRRSPGPNSGSGDSLIDMQSGAVANNLAFIEYDFDFVDADHGPELVIEELLPAVFNFFRESDPVAPIASVIFSRSNTLKIRVRSSGNCFSTPSFPTMTIPSSR
jgi:hypothetical protein